MKKIQKKLLFLELENIKSTYDRKIKMLDNIIMFYLDEDSRPNSDTNNNTEIIKFEEEMIKDKDEVFFEEQTTEEKEEVNEPQEEKVIEEPKKEKIEPLPPDIKNIYRKIMMITHPDKIKENVNKEEYSEYYKRAVESKNTNNKSEIIYIGYKLNIEDVFNIDIKHFDNIKFKITQLKLESNGIENSPFWVWYHTDNDKLKSIMDLNIKRFTKR